MSSSLTLIVLAAGLGSRFGGNKHSAEVGPQGQCLFEYSVSDAMAAGFDHIIFVVNPSQDTDQIQQRLGFCANHVKIEYVAQSLDLAIPPDIGNSCIANRIKPWGTAHAVLVCRQYIDNPFALINADDFYSAENFSTIANYLQENRHNAKAAVMPGYKLGNTLSESGGVNRGICKVDKNGYLETIEEVKDISINVDSASQFRCEDAAQAISEDSIVSMNFWGFQPEIFECFEASFCEFISSPTISPDAELLIPAVVDRAINANVIQVKVLPTDAQWQGLTHLEDVIAVKQFIQLLVNQGEYPNMSRRAV